MQANEWGFLHYPTLRALLAGQVMLVAFLFSAPTFAEERRTTYYVTTAEAPVYARQSSRSSVLKSLGLADSFEADVTALHWEWVPYREAWRGSVDGWVARKQLITEADFTPVTDCWPFSRVEVAVGDWFQYAEIDWKGIGKAGGNSGEGPAKAFVSGRVLKIEYQVTSKDSPGKGPAQLKMLLAYDPRTRSASPPRELGDEIVQVQSDAPLLRGCVGINARKP